MQVNRTLNKKSLDKLRALYLAIDEVMQDENLRLFCEAVIPDDQKVVHNPTYLELNNEDVSTYLMPSGEKMPIPSGNASVQDLFEYYRACWYRTCANQIWETVGGVSRISILQDYNAFYASFCSYVDEVKKSISKFLHEQDVLIAMARLRRVDFAINDSFTNAMKAVIEEEEQESISIPDYHTEQVSASSDEHTDMQETEENPADPVNEVPQDAIPTETSNTETVVSEEQKEDVSKESENASDPDRSEEQISQETSDTESNSEDTEKDVSDSESDTVSENAESSMETTFSENEEASVEEAEFDSESESENGAAESEEKDSGSDEQLNDSAIEENSEETENSEQKEENTEQPYPDIKKMDTSDIPGYDEMPQAQRLSALLNRNHGKEWGN